MSTESPIDFTGQVAIVTGAGRGLGRSYALDLARRGANVVVNDLGAAMDGEGGSASAAQAVVDEIEAAGGSAMANTASVTDADAMSAMAAAAMEEWGRIDVFVANAGILRDKTFAKMDLDDFRAVVEVHLIGAATSLKPAWDVMREQRYGRVVLATSGAGTYGNFGQTNYASAKLGLVGMMKTLNIEGERRGIKVNAIAPAATTRMTEGLQENYTQARIDAMDIENVTPGLVYLCAEDAPIGVVLNAGGGIFSVSTIYDTVGIDRAVGLSAEDVRDQWEAITDVTDMRHFRNPDEWAAACADRYPQ